MARKAKVPKANTNTGVGNKLTALVGTNKFKLGSEEFEAKPFKERMDDFVYDDSINFMAKGLPLVFKILGTINTIQNYGVLDDGTDVDFSAELFADLDIAAILTKIGNELPELVAIVCHASDPSINAGDVKRLVRTFTDFEMIRAVLIQTKLEGFGESLAKLKIDAQSLNVSENA